MAVHGFTDAGWEQYKDDRAFNRGGKRQAPRLKSFRRKGGGDGGGGEVAILARTVATSDVDDGKYGVELSAAKFYQGADRVPAELDAILVNDTEDRGIVEGQSVWIILAAGDDPEASETLWDTYGAGCPPDDE